MSMRYFTLSAVCMLVFCMLLALSGTTDFPGPPRETLSQSGTGSAASGPTHSGVGEAMASVYPLPDDSATHDVTGMPRGGTLRNRPLLLLGFLLVAAWVLLSFRLLPNAEK